MFEELRKFFAALFGTAPEYREPHDDGIVVINPPRESYTAIPFEQTETLPVEEFLAGSPYVPSSNNAIVEGNYYDNLRARIAAEEAFHTKLMGESVAFITRLGTFNLRKGNMSTAEIDEERARLAFGHEYGGYVGSIDQAKLEEKTKEFGNE